MKKWYWGKYDEEEEIFHKYSEYDSLEELFKDNGIEDAPLNNEELWWEMSPNLWMEVDGKGYAINVVDDLESHRFVPNELEESQIMILRASNAINDFLFIDTKTKNYILQILNNEYLNNKKELEKIYNI